jgi:hypothetical protein
VISNVIRSYTISSMMEDGLGVVMKNYVSGLDLGLRRRMKRRGLSIGMRCGYFSRGRVHGLQLEW